MQPDEQTPEDYLNQIAPQSTSKWDFLKKKPIMIGGIIVAIMLILMMISAVSSLMSTSKVQTEHLAARLVATKEIVTSSSDKIKDSSLSATNSQLSIYMTSMINKLTTVLKSENIDINKLDKNITSAESDSDALSRLEDARLNGIYDRTYAREMAYQLETDINLMNQVYKTTKNSDMKAFITDAESNLTTIQESFDSFND